MEVIASIPTDENRELLKELTNEYRSLKDDYTLQGARKQALNNLLSGKFVPQPIDEFDPTINLDFFLMKAEELSDAIILNDNQLENEDNHDSELEENIQLELHRGQELLERILKEQTVVMDAIMTSRKQLVDLNNADVISSKENEAPSNTRNPVETVLDDPKLRSIHKARDTYV